ncbi:hypothetical protein VH12019_00283 [Vibrio phage VH1_2019]|uniref:Major capsid protein n=2 Tax=Schizotequatrovirus KVP40 TaxID=1914019 RepID=A0A6B9SYJ3_9CAUD|nr:hypothetical protein pp2_019 [Vibrio phage phi-pp2]QHJ74202.1 hypothetical protein VH12019_00283 [Vibrio phage VH1_2019]WOL24931.1 capsid vertex protein [Vibrio phage PG216]
MSVAKRGADGFYALRLSRLLHLRFDRWEAYRMGIIDADGKKLRDPVTAQEKSNWTLFHVTVRNIKRMVGALPGGKTALDYGASYLLLIELAKEYGLSDQFADECIRVEESVVAGDSGGDVGAIASGETTGAVTSAGPETLGDKKKKKKKKLKKFRHFD